MVNYHSSFYHIAIFRSIVNSDQSCKITMFFTTLRLAEMKMSGINGSVYQNLVEKSSSRSLHSCSLSHFSPVQSSQSSQSSPVQSSYHTLNLAESQFGRTMLGCLSSPSKEIDWSARAALFAYAPP